MNSQKEPKYVVTGVSRLTGEREVISRPHSEWKAREMRERMLRYQRRRPAYTRLNVERAERELALPFV